MDLNAFDRAYNSMAPADLVAYQIPQFLVPAHSAALVVIPDERGGLLQYGWYTGACCRIWAQDSLAIQGLVQQRILAPETAGLMTEYLGKACGADTPQLTAERMHIGNLMLANYQRIGVEDQLFWLRHDAEVRRTLSEYYQGVQGLHNGWAPQAAQVLAQVGWDSHSTALPDMTTARLRLIELNQQQLDHVVGIIPNLLALLPTEKVAKVAELCEINLVALDRANNLKALQEGWDLFDAPTQGAPAPSRPPLALVSANIQQAPAPMKQTETLKRKRTDPAPKKMSEVVDLLEESDDEDALQNQVDALQAKIAAIRQRTAHEDQVVPTKKTKSNRKPAATGRNTPATTAPIPVAKNVSRIVEQQKPTTTPPSPADPFQPPPSSQDRRAAPSSHVDAVASKPNMAQTRSLAKPDTTQRRQKQSLQPSTAGKGQQTARPVGRSVPPLPTQQTVASTARAPMTLAAELSGFHSSAGRGLNTVAQFRRDHEKFTKEFTKKVNDFTQRVLKATSSSPVVDLTTTAAAPAPSIAFTKQSQSAHDIVADQPVPRDQPILCAEQQEVVDCIMAGHNVFYTGSAGCGKSTVLKTFVPLLREQGKQVRIVAPTGKAALDINGSTTWTFAGWTPLHMKRPLQQLRKESHGKFVNARLRRTDVLVIDEISMVENHLFARLNAILKEARGDQRAFGGVQLIVTGDFCQLPPVKPFQYCIHCGREQPQRIVDKEKIVYRCPMHGDCNDEDKWAFRSAAWEECEFKHVNLTNIHRQSDEVFIKVLQKLRIGTTLTETDRRLLLNHPCDITNAVKLFPTRDQVKRINQTEFDRLTSAKHSYTCLDMFRWNQEKHPHLQSKGNRSPYDESLDALREHRLDTFVEYKKDMLVVLLTNLDITAGLVNGSQGRIVGFEPNDEAKLPKANRNGPGGSSSSSRLASSQWKRKRREDSSEPDGIGSKGELRGEYALLREGQIRMFISNARNKSKMWPIVEFDNGQKRTIYADCQVNELGDEREYTLLARTQIPLIAAWAMTIHKSQGMTLNKVIVDLGKSFEEGQEYVALSRARSLDGLKVLSLGDGEKGGNAQVKEFLWRKFKLR